MDNIILSGMVKEFVDKFKLSSETPESQFEKFSNYCLLKTDHYDSFDFEKVGTGDCVGVDGVAVSIGGVIVDEIEDAKKFTRAQFEVRFVFSQAKTSPSFSLGDFLKFVTTVRNFFKNDSTTVPNQLKKAWDIKQLIYGDAASKLKELPVVELSYVYTGKFNSKDETLRLQIEEEIKLIQDIPYHFSRVSWHVHDGESIAKLYRETQNDILAEVPFQRHVAMPKIRGAKSAYLGVVKCIDYVKIITKQDGEINRGLFFDNVRDFLGPQNPVNEDIATTIKKTTERDRFSILNNGITIVAKSVVPSGDIFKITRFQIVNGCQTSHVLFGNRQSLSDDMYLTVKLIETSDVDLSGQIIATTNSQSVVTKEAFATIKPYHRKIEEFFTAMRSTGYGYYYERRPHQYDDYRDIQQQYVISAPSLIKSFISVVVEEPHKVHYYYGTLLSEYNRNQSNELFSDGDYPGSYFLANHIVFRTKGKVYHDRRLKEWSFQLALLVKRALIPELKKELMLNDGKFLELMAFVDQYFDKAYVYAADFMLKEKLNPQNNRSIDTTRDLLLKFNNSLGTQFSQYKQSKQPSKTFKFINGKYIGTLEKVDQLKRKASIMYGPFKIECEIESHAINSLPTGSRVSVIFEENRILATTLEGEEQLNI